MQIRMPFMSEVPDDTLRQLHESEQRYRRLVENAPDAIIVHCDGKLLFANAAAARLWGVDSPSELIGRNSIEFVYPESRELVRQRMRQVLDDGAPAPVMELTHVRGGKRVEVEASATPCVYQGKPCSQVIIRDITDRKRVEAELLRANAELERRVQFRTQELLRKNDELESEIQERRRAEVELQDNQKFLERMLHLHERERQLISYEIHDTFVQDVIAALMFCDSFRVEAIAAGQPNWEMFDQARGLLRGALDEARRTISGLRPPIIDEQGIVAGIEFLASEFKQRGLDVEFSAGEDIPRLPPLLEGCVFRIVQEALNNMQRHSGVKQGTIELKRSDDMLRLAVADSGVGFDPHGLPAGRFGLQGMRERARLLSGHLVLDSAPGQGTTVRLEMPIVPREPADA